MDMRLIQIYREEVSGLPSKDAQAVRSYWHAAAKRYLNMASITSDPIPAYQPNATTGIITMPHIGAWLHRSVEELVEVYRATKPKRPPQKV